VSIKQKRLQLPTKLSNVRLANPGWQTVPEPRSGGCEAPIAEPCVGPWNAARVDVGRSEPATAGVRDKLAVVYKICCSCIVERLVDQEGQLELRLVVSPKARGVASTLVWCGHINECRWRVALPRSAQTVGAWTDCLWCHWTERYSSQDDM